jgi:hypothetical protein
MFIRSRRWVSILLIIGVAATAADSTIAAPPKKRKKRHPPPNQLSHDPQETKDKPAIESAKVPAIQYRGKIVSAPNEGGLFRVAVEYQRVRVKRGKEAEYDRLQKDSVRQRARSAASQTRAESRLQMTPVRGHAAPLPDRRAISQSFGISDGAATMARGEKGLLKGLLETVSDTQTVIFHADTKIQVRVLKPSDQQVVTTLKPSENPQDSSSSDAQNRADHEGKKPAMAPLPGYEGAMADLKVGQRILLRLVRPITLPPGALYKEVVTLVVVEEETGP